jgi:DNA-binding MarR family transcriptional regulator
VGEHVILAFLLECQKPASIREIVENTGLAQSWVSTVVQSLRKRGWVDVAKDANDRRSTTVTCRPEITSGTRHALSRDATAAVVSLVPTATEAEYQAIENGLNTLASILTKQDISPNDQNGTESYGAWPERRMERILRRTE